MAKSPLNAAEMNAQSYFKKAEQTNTLAKQTRKKERSAIAANTARLRGLRLAKEELEKEEADKAAAEHAAKNPGAPEPVKARRVAKTKPPAMKRMIY